MENVSHEPHGAGLGRLVDYLVIKGRQWTVGCGACRGNPGPMSIGASVQTLDGTELDTVGAFLGDGTNNMAEYHAAIEQGTDEMSRMDFQLVVSHLTGESEVTKEALKPLRQELAFGSDSPPPHQFRAVEFLPASSRSLMDVQLLGLKLLQSSSAPDPRLSWIVCKGYRTDAPIGSTLAYSRQGGSRRLLR
jgi:hypothetical protein